ncbi:ComEC/Rec2 family competence protein [Microlunatus capsulatus]|uniref:Competence protein ComEC n=1 Tax=Microlunatus capsulatus TaxID=99117 RepID=A0ABS4Z4N4_9ACTN|nr:ComEC/Rec2 family competence protein [Microlunatus capsulatus]MBP2416006.1 competence protein ComEC [Microlunatus capsulatus]
MSEPLVRRAGAALAARLRPRRSQREPETDVVRDLRVVPLALAAWAAAWAGTGGSPRLALLGLAGVGLAAAAAVLRRRRVRPRPGRPRGGAWLVATVLVALVVGGLGAVQAHRLRSGPPARLAAAGAVVDARLELVGDARRVDGAPGRPPVLVADGRLLELTGRGGRWRVRVPVTVLVSGEEVGWWAAQPVGTSVVVPGRLQSPDPGDDVAAVLRVRAPPTAVFPPGAGGRLVERVRAGLRAAVADRPAEPRALVPALVLGDTSGITAELRGVFQTTGLTHLTAVSGANLTLLLAFLLLGARWSGVRGWWLRGVGLLGVAVFVALCRTEPSVLRAAAMGLVALAALGAGGRRAGLRNLGVAMLGLLLVEPFLARSWGFALSVLASGGIIWWARPWADVLARWLPRLLAESVTLPLAAHLTTLPVVVLLSGRVSVVGLLANALAGPFVGPATVLGFAAAGASLVSAPAAALLGRGAAWSAQAIVTVARVGARLPGADVGWPAGPAAVLVLAAGCLLAALLVPWVLARRLPTVLLALALVVALVRVPSVPGWPPPGWRLVVCDVGQGDGLVLRAGPGSAVVVDAGPEPDRMRRCLDALGVREVPLLVLTHFHADHADGLPGVLAGRAVRQVWVSPLAEPAAEVASVRAAAAAEGAAVVVPVPGARVRVGEVALRVVGPLPPRGGDGDPSGVQNDASVVLVADVGGLGVLLPGDVEPPGQRALLTAGVDLRATVLKVPHHGSSRQEPAFFAATGARLAVASAGQDNDYGHPAARTVELARSLGMTVLSTDRVGSVAVTGTDADPRVVTQRPP